jgi:glycosyltransferase involved in cell wall biosynthesis
MSCEVPVVASRAGGIPEIVVDGETGFLAKVGDVESMAAKAIEILQNPRLAKKMGQRARQLVENKFMAESIINQYEKLYFDLLSKPSKRPFSY